MIGLQPVFVPRSVLLQAEWVLRAVYGVPPGSIIPALRALGGLPHVSIENSDPVASAMDMAEAGMDFADALHLAASTGCDDFLTFDKRLARAGARLGGVAVVAL